MHWRHSSPQPMRQTPPASSNFTNDTWNYTTSIFIATLQLIQNVENISLINFLMHKGTCLRPYMPCTTFHKLIGLLWIFHVLLYKGMEWWWTTYSYFSQTMKDVYGFLRLYPSSPALYTSYIPLGNGTANPALFLVLHICMVHTLGREGSHHALTALMSHYPLNTCIHCY